MTIEPERGAEPLDCFGCVRQKVDRHGGRMQFGWVIWEWPLVYIEAAHHAVYEPPAGPPWVDITPSGEADETRRLFLRDDSAVYSFENDGFRRDNIRMALGDDPRIQDFFKAAELRCTIFNGLPGLTIGDVAVSPEDERRLDEIEQTIARLTSELAMKYTGRHERCFCGSGKKFMYCCGADRE